MKTSTAGIAFTKAWEGCKLAAYQDSVGVWTIGYSHTRTAKKGMTITQEQADALLLEDIAV
ncbi:lysozyme [Pseudomonas sp. F1_0610]|uniref:lysozyme n=1 Tax=Pseudomonas sp. F1_0610 TaxID=3114284 RepID=UPI0039C0E1B9